MGRRSRETKNNGAGSYKATYSAFADEEPLQFLCCEDSETIVPPLRVLHQAASVWSWCPKLTPEAAADLRICAKARGLVESAICAYETCRTSTRSPSKCERSSTGSYNMRRFDEAALNC